MIKNNIEIKNEYKFISAFVICVEAQEIENIAKQSNIVFVSSIAKAVTLVDVSRQIVGLNKIDISGENVTCAVIDTGICNHFDFVLGRNRIVEFVDLVDGKTKAYDNNGHGTFVSGVLCGSGLASNFRFKGFAPCCNIVSVKALDETGEGDAIAILNAMDYVFNNAKRLNIKVVCMSFGSEPIGFNDPIMKASEKLWDSGIVVVAAAGNSGPNANTIKSPGISSKIITVGGFDDNRIEKEINEKFFEVANFSSRGPALNKIKPDVVAPSVDITSCGINNNYVVLSGTSVATPMIAGLCVLIAQSNPNLTPDKIKRKLISICKPICFDFQTEGFGYPKIE